MRTHSLRYLKVKNKNSENKLPRKERLSAHRCHRRLAYRCAGRCGGGYNPSLSCQCNDECSQHGNCCSDYNTCSSGGGGSSSNSCAGRCDASYDSSLSCQCNDQCEQHGNCCGDYSDECSSAGGNTGGGGSCSKFQSNMRTFMAVFWRVFTLEVESKIRPQSLYWASPVVFSCFFWNSSCFSAPVSGGRLAVSCAWIWDIM